MQAIEWIGPRQMRQAERPKPTPLPHEALLRIESVGVCGSDIHYYVDGHIGDQVVTPPLILGHEYAGIVEAVGDDADASLIGKRVAVEPGIPCTQCESCRTGHYNVCREMFFPGGPGSDGALSEYYTVHAGFCHPVPEGMTADVAAMIEPLAVAIHTVELAQLKPGESAAVVGLGPIGLLVAEVLRACGAGTIYGSDLLSYRVAVAGEFGVEHAINADTLDFVAEIERFTGGRGVDVAFDCTNRSEGLGIATRATRPAGRVILTGISGAENDPLPVSVARRRELSLHWCRRFKNNYPAALRLIETGQVDVRKLITHSFPLHRTQEAFDLVAEYGDGVLKASIDF